MDNLLENAHLVLVELDMNSLLWSVTKIIINYCYRKWLTKYFIVCFLYLYLTEVSALFEAGTSVTYMFQEPYPVTKNINLSSSSIYIDAAPSKENIAFSFMASQSPSLLLYVNSSQNFLAIMLCKNGE